MDASARLSFNFIVKAEPPKSLSRKVTQSDLHFGKNMSVIVFQVKPVRN